MPMYNVIEYSSNFSETTIAQSAPNAANEILKNETIAVPVKYFINSWRSLEMPLINCIVGLKLKWRKYCILSVAGNENDINNNDKDNNNIFTVKDTK